MLANHQGLLEEINHMASTDPDAQAREHAATVIMVRSMSYLFFPIWERSPPLPR